MAAHGSVRSLFTLCLILSGVVSHGSTTAPCSEDVARLAIDLQGPHVHQMISASEELTVILGSEPLIKVLTSQVEECRGSPKQLAIEALGVLAAIDTEHTLHLLRNDPQVASPVSQFGRLSRFIVPSRAVSEAALGAVADSLHDPDPHIRYAAVKTLSHMLVSDRTRGLESVTHHLVHEMPVEQISELLIVAVGSLRSDEVNQAEAWLGIMDSIATRDPGAGLAVAPALGMLINHWDVNLGWKALGVVDKLGRQAFLEELIQQLSHDDPVLRWGAAKAFEEFGWGIEPAMQYQLRVTPEYLQRAVERLALLVTDADDEVQNQAVRALDRLADGPFEIDESHLLGIAADETKPDEVRAGALRLYALNNPAASALDLYDRYEVYNYQTVVFQQHSDGYHTFRIPSLIVTPQGTLLAFAEGRRHSDSDDGDIDVVVKRSDDQGLTWSALQVVWGDGNNRVGDPTPVVDWETGRLWLFVTRHGGSERQAAIHRGEYVEGRSIWAMYSDDDGRTWSAPRNLTAEGIKNPTTHWDVTGPSVGIQLRHGPNRGRLVIPALGRIIYSDDHGETWHQGGLLDGTSETQVVELSDGRLMRNDRAVARQVPNRRPLTYSVDQGATWQYTRYAPELLTPYSQGSTVRLRPADSGDRTLLFSNPSSTLERVNMSIHVSFDDGDTWPVKRVIHPRVTSYSSLAVLPDQTIGLLFEADTHRHQRVIANQIRFARVAFDWVVDARQ